MVIETDIFDDVDDVGALVVAHALADEGTVEIAAVLVNTPSRWGGLAVAAINRAFGRPGIPVGSLAELDDRVARNDFAHALVQAHGREDDSRAIEPAGRLWNRVLDSAADHSLTLVSLGFYGILVGLLDDAGADTVARKIERAAVMGGRFPSGVEYNFAAAPELTRAMLTRWPTPLDLLGWEIGAEIETGRGLTSSDRVDLVSSAYRAFCGRRGGRPSWDLLAVLLAVDPERWGFELSPPGSVAVEADGHNTWTPEAAGRMRYTTAIRNPIEVARALDAMLEGAIDRRFRPRAVRDLT
ncbi:hypothetical protein [Leifsonia sp. NPDC080035]|uniref:Inosine/uridine-preferring nucleoside hydrolase domain-containing protein n=1 Tax=Leifsonia sp. NPDC080035 TaxID=3143936 RepID=A0AAU7GCM7_9MICO